VFMFQVNPDEWKDQPEMLDDEEPINPDHMPPKRAAKVRRGEAVRVVPCKPRDGASDGHTTQGALYTYCACGFMAPPLEMVSHESCTQVSCQTAGRVPGFSEIHVSFSLH
jgi:hypothetical protein